MLLKNGVEFNLDAPENAKELNAFLDEFPNFKKDGGIVVKFHDSLIYWDHLNNKRGKPAMRTLPNRQVINRPGKGNETWIYCENYEQHQSTNAILTRTPWTFDLAGSRGISWLNKDLAFFLWISPKCGNGEAANPKNPVYIFENKEAEAQKQLDKERLEARVKSLILNDDTEGGLSNHKISEMARAYQISGNVGNYESRQKLFRATTIELGGFKKFLALLEDPGQKERLITIQKAKEMGLLICKGIKIEAGTGNNQGWRILDREGETKLIFGKHRKSKQHSADPDKFLWNAIEEDNKIYTQIAEAVESRSVVAEVED